MRLLALALLLLPHSALASRPSVRNAHPIGWMHMLPAGETPGWSSKAWFDFELNHANVWNRESSMIDRRTGAVYTYTADFEQTSAIFDVGVALSESWALSAELPYANRNGGFLDDFIDQFHQLIRSDRFMRHHSDDFNNVMGVQTDGVDALATERGQGMGSAKLKLKWWPIKWRGGQSGACDCGFALSAQAKFPTQPRKFALSSGDNDYSFLAHLGVPIGQRSGMWFTGAVTKLGANETFAGWPRREWLQMYEVAFDLAISERFGFILQLRTESPLMMREHLDFDYTNSTHSARLAERIASGWNSLTAWRGTQAFGFRWRWGQGHEVNLLMVEDWGTGDRDERADWLYVTNAPDVAFVSQLHIAF